MIKSPQKNSGLGFFNQVRGLGLLWIIAGHSMALFMTGSGATMEVPVFSGAGRVLGGGVLAMFFMISGLYFYRRSPRKCVHTQAKLLLRPYILTCAAITAVKAFLALLSGGDFWGQIISLSVSYLLGMNVTNGAQFLGITLKSISIFWFVLALFGGWVVYNSIVSVKNRNLRVLLVITSVVAGWVLTVLSAIWPYSLPMALMAVGYIAVGHMIREHNLLNRKLPRWLWWSIGSVTLVSLAFGYVDIAGGKWKLGLLDVAGSFCVGFLLLRLYNRLSQIRLNGFIARGIEKVGLNSIWIICLHAFEKEVINWRRLQWMLPEHPVLCMVLCFVGRCAVMYLLYVSIFQMRKQHHMELRRKIVITEE